MPILVLALLALIAGPLAQALGTSCAAGGACQRPAESVCRCSAEAVAAGLACCARGESDAARRAAPASGRTETAPADAGQPAPGPASAPGIVCPCALSQDTAPAGVLAANAVRTRALLAQMVAPATTLPAGVLPAAPEGALPLDPHRGMLPGPQCDFRPDAGRAPPVR